MQLKDKKILVVGLARTGVAVVRFLAARGAQVTVTDMRDEDKLADSLAELADLEINLELGRHVPYSFLMADLIVVSPGVPMDIKPLAMARSQKRRVVSEVELASWFIDAPMIAITGTNGKTTTTTLTGEIFRACGFDTFVGGNIGRPLIELACSGEKVARVVVELSSFQLETIASFRPRWAVLLNITEDHLDRYPDMNSYQAAKARLFENLTGADFMVLNVDDPRVMQAAANAPARCVPFSGAGLLEEGMSLADGTLVWRWDGAETRFPAMELHIGGQHNLENVMAALIPPLVEGCPPAVAWGAATAFRGLPHRMELVAESNGVRWYDDSKGTNVGSVVKSLAGLPAPVTLIAGGKDKHGELAPLKSLIADRVRELILIGEAAPRMAAAFAGLTSIRHAGSMAEAVELAAELTPAGGTVLLSPGCSSFDMFSSYEERGRIFAAAVKALTDPGEAAHGA